MISVIIPAYNEEENIKKAVEEVKKVDLNEELEVIVVDDGSTDNTIKKAAESKADELVSYKPNMGKGYAMRKGVEKARGEKVFFTDADQCQVDKLSIFLNKLKEETVVIGKRDWNNVPWTRRINISLTKLAILMATGKTVKDPICGIRAIYKETFEELKLKENGFEIESEINLKALKKGLNIDYVSIKVPYYKGAFEFNELNWKKSFRLAVYLAKSVLKSWSEKLSPKKSY